jgi:hypothetical protein
MSVEHFSDNSQSLLKALHHSTLAKQYFEDAKFGYKGGVKEFMNICIAKIEYVVNGVRLKLNPELLKEVDADLSDSLAFDSIKDILVKLNTSQRQMIESLALSLSKGEEIQILDESLKY